MVPGCEFHEVCCAEQGSQIAYCAQTVLYAQMELRGIIFDVRGFIRRDSKSDRTSPVRAGRSKPEKS